MRLYLFVLLIICSPMGYAARVLRVLPGQTAFAISHDFNRTWSANDVVCVVRGTRELACGYVVKVGPRGALVKVNTRTGDIAPGDTVRISSAAKLQRGPSSVANTSYGVSKTTPDYSDINLTAGVIVGSNYLVPVIHFDVAVANHFTLGLFGGYSTSTDPTTSTSLNMIPIVASFAYYSDFAYSGFWAQLGLGIHLLSASSPGLNESAKSPTGIGTVGWRFHFRNGINLGLAVGGEYISLPTFQSLSFNFHNPQGVAMIDVGFNF
jgi:hypothetical protein